MKLAILAFLIAFPSSVVPHILSAQSATSQARVNPHDLSAQIKSFANFSKDFRAMQEPVRGIDFDTLHDLDNMATNEEDRLFAANGALQLFDSITCQQDRVSARRILKDQLLDYYSWVFDHDITTISGLLTFVKIPAAAQLGLRMKDEMRAAKEKIDAIAASL
ncbi:MAG: hypothetical protein WAM91_05110 [Candidatus Acidiferrales bacterium]